MSSFAEQRKELLESLNENDTAKVENMGVTFGTNEEYYCLYLQKFTYMSWSSGRSIEFRPFRNIRIFQKYENFNYRKIGYFKAWLFNPEYTYQIYNNGQPCSDEKYLNKNSTTYVKFLCGINNRIVSFKEIQKCVKYQLDFESPSNCKLTMTDKDKNLHAIQLYGPITLNDMWLFFILILVFLISTCLCLLRKKHLI